MASRARTGLWAATVAAGVAAVALLASPAGAEPAGAPGNNGTVKIHDGAGEPSPVTQDEPHVCTFHVHALYFDSGQVFTFTVQSWEPTGDRSVVLSGSITADATGEGRLRSGGGVRLPDGHYRLTVDTGNGTTTQDKHKMFWVECAAETSPPPSPRLAAAELPVDRVPDVAELPADATAGADDTRPRRRARRRRARRPRRLLRPPARRRPRVRRRRRRPAEPCRPRPRHTRRGRARLHRLVTAPSRASAWRCCSRVLPCSASPRHGADCSATDAPVAETRLPGRLWSAGEPGAAASPVPCTVGTGLAPC